MVQFLFHGVHGLLYLAQAGKSLYNHDNAGTGRKQMLFPGKGVLQVAIRMVGLDLDGTLTNSRKEITPSTRDALIDIQKNGKKVVLASGRPSQGVLPLAEELHLGDYGSYILSYNGGRITDCRSGEIIYSKYLPNDVAAPLLEIVKNYPGIEFLAYTATELITGGDTNDYSE